ncbi:MAG TPA: ABC transporter ATP-binding protein, partial [Candidatus Saccharimonadales bacterium]
MQQSVISLFWHQTWQHKKYVLGILGLLPPTLLMHQYLPPLVLAEILNRLAGGDYSKGDLWGSFGWLLVLYIALRFTSATFMWRAVILLVGRLEAAVVQAFQQKIFRQIMQQSAHFHASRPGGSLVAAAQRFTAAYAKLAESAVMQFAPLLLSFLFAIIILWPRAPLYILSLLLLSVIYIAITFICTKSVRQKTTAEAAVLSTLSGALADSVTNVLAVKSFAAEEREEKQFRHITRSARKKFLDTLHTTQLNELYFSSVTATITSVSVVLAVAGVVVFNTDIATAFLVVEYTSLLTARLWEFTNSTLKTYNRSIGDAVEIAKLLAQKPAVTDASNSQVAAITKGAIDFKEVNFHHVGANEAIFRQFTLHIAAGQKLGLIGPSGSGKTTLTKLLLRFADIDDGSISIDSQDIRSISQHDLRRHI